jgi:HK97 family phage prohead protease
MHVKSVPIGRVKAGPEDGLEEGQFIVYPSTFIKEPDSYGDIVAKGAFLEDIEAWKSSGNVLPGLYGHRMDDPDFFVAGALDMGEDDHGWWVKGEFDLESPKGPQVYRLVKGRRLNQLSFAYDTLDEKSVTLEDGRKANELQRLKVYEFSFVPIGANQDTSVVAVKALADAVAGEFKAGRVLAQKHIDSLRSAQDAIGVVIDAAEAINDQEKASGPPQSNDEEPPGAKSKRPVEPSARTLAEALDLEIEVSV